MICSNLKNSLFFKTFILSSFALFLWALLLNMSVLQSLQSTNLSFRSVFGNSNPNTIPISNIPTAKTELRTPKSSKPRIQTKVLNINEMRRQKIINMTLHGWNGYKKHAWGSNELKPISKRQHNADIFGHTPHLGATIIDSMDTLYIMGLKKEFEEAANWVRDSFNIEIDTNLSLFEVNIRIIGGLLSAFTLSQKRLFLDKAVEVANRMLPAFDTPTGIPARSFNPAEYESSSNMKPIRTFSILNSILSPSTFHNGGCSILAELGTLSLEFTYLTDLTGNRVYEEKINKIYETLEKVKKPDGIYFDHIDTTRGYWCTDHASMGALSDSFYEYLFKLWLYKSKRDRPLLNTYVKAMDAVKKKIIKKSRSGLLYTGDYTSSGGLMPQMEHLACFSGGLFALTSMYAILPRSQRRDFADLAIELTKTCHKSYSNTATGLGPESFALDTENEPTPINPVYILRPEVIESYFYLWKMTGEQKYREWAWQAALSIETYCRTPDGYSGIKNVNWPEKPGFDDVQQSFFFAETLKYLYLIFSDEDILPLDKYVFNTEAHPFRIRE